MTTMIETAVCGECKGTQSVPHHAAGTTYSCVYCDGSGVRKARGHGGYRTAAGAAKALRTGTGVRCDSCKGKGECVRPATTRCYSCHDGLVVTRAMPGAAWAADVPRGVRYGSMRDEVAAEYSAAVRVVVRAENRAGTWNEAHLGLGSIVSSTDYGRRWDAMVTAARAGTEALEAATEALREEGRQALRGTQYVKITRADDTLAETILVTLHRNGYIVQAVNVQRENVSLPPTYTESVLSRPMV